MKKSFILLFSAMALLSACSESQSEKDTEEKDYVETKYDKEISAFLEDKDWSPERQESGLYVYIENEGSEEKPTLDSYLKIHYKGTLLNGEAFDGTGEYPASFPFTMSNLIPGWQEGLTFFGKGGKGKLLIPPALGYGENPAGNIPPNSVLYFEIELVDFANEPMAQEHADYTADVEAYMTEKGLSGFTKTESGLFVKVEKEGSEEKPALDDFLTLSYRGYLTDGFVFDENENITFNAPLSQMIPGWQEGIPYFGKGGNGMLIIPPYLGYGDREAGDIPANSILVFEFDIQDFSKTYEPK